MAYRRCVIANSMFLAVLVAVVTPRAEAGELPIPFPQALDAAVTVRSFKMQNEDSVPSERRILLVTRKERSPKQLQSRSGQERQIPRAQKRVASFRD